MKYLLLVVTLMIVVNAQAQQVVSNIFTVEVEALSDGGKSDQKRLKEKAVLQAKDIFPSLVEGTESLRDGEYKQNIESVTLVFADTKIISMALVAHGTHLKGEVMVTLDVSASLSMLRDLQLKKQLKKDVDSAVAEMTMLMKGEVSKSDMVRLSKLRQDVEVALLMSGEVASAEDAVRMREDAFLQERVDLMKLWSEEAQWEVTNLNPHEGLLSVTVRAPDMQEQYRALQKKYDNDSFAKSVKGAVCGISKAGLHFMVDVFPVAPNDTSRTRYLSGAAKEVKFDFRYYGSDLDVSMFKTSFKILPCY